MSDTEYRRIFQLARDRALTGFALMVQRVMQEAYESLERALGEQRSAAEKYALSSARQTLRQGGEVFARRSEALFRSYLERAMRTMYTDLRPDLTKMSADDLSLIDDETVNRQIQVDRLVTRLRNEGQEVIGRLNVIIGRLHGDPDGRERENPFRPYVLARTIHETANDVAAEDGVAQSLFEHVSDALVRNFPAYCTDILAAFEKSGIRAQFAPRLSKTVWNQRESGMRPEPLPPDFAVRVLPRMLHVLELLQHLPLSSATQVGAGSGQGAATLQDFMRGIFSPDERIGAWNSIANGLRPASRELISQLNLYQSMVARGEAIVDSAGEDQNQLFALQEKIGPDKATVVERGVIDVVGMLFEFILENEKIPLPVRGQLARLQIPLLKAAMLEPDLLKDAGHPARRLLDRLCSVAVDCDSDTSVGAAIAGEISLVAKNILCDFESDTAIFADVLDGFEHALPSRLCNADDGIATCAAVLERAEKEYMLRSAASGRLAELLTPLKADQRVADFITDVWTQVLVKAFLHDAEHGDTCYPQYHDLLADLVWSVREKQDSQERGALMRLLPDLVKRLKTGMEFIGLPEAQSREAMDRLVELHMQAMRPAPPKNPQEQYSLMALQQRFSSLKIDEAASSWGNSEIYQVEPATIEAALAARNIPATVCIDPKASPLGEEEHLSLSGLLPGTSLEYGTGNETEGLKLRLVWVSPQRPLYLFKPNHDAKPIVHSASSLFLELNEGGLQMAEQAPVFERAAASLVAGAATVS